MSKVLILVGSARKGGNTDLLAQSFAQGAQAHHDVEIISVADVSVKPCTGCNACAAAPGYRCVQRDDMDKIYDSLSRADVLVLASPVYFYGVSAQLKAVIDRLHTPLRNAFKLKKLALLLVGAAL